MILHRLRIAALALILPLATCHAPPAAPAHHDLPTAPTTLPAATSRPQTASNFINARAIILLRHGDIDVAQKRTLGDKVPLLDRGQARARELAYALKDAGITRIVTSEALRTQQTAAVLAEQLHLKPETPFQHGAYMQGDHNKQENSTVVEYLAQNAKPSDVILVVHHHSVLPGILTELGFPNEPHYDDVTEFDRAYVVLPNPKTQTYQLLRLRYGGNWHQPTD